MMSSKESLFDLFITNEILALLGILMTAIFFYIRRMRINRRVFKNGISVPATIVKFDTTFNFFRGLYTHPIELHYEFNGKTYVHKTLIHRFFFDFYWHKRYYKGKVIEISIDPEDPEYFVSHHMINNRASPPKDTIIYVVLLFWGLALCYFYAKSK